MSMPQIIRGICSFDKNPEDDGSPPKDQIVPKHNRALGVSQTNQQVKTDQNTVLSYLSHCHTSKLSKGGHYRSTLVRLSTDVNIWSICSARTTEQKISSAHTLFFKSLNSKELVFKSRLSNMGSFPLENSPLTPSIGLL